MDLVVWLFDFILNVDQHLLEAATTYGAWVYAILFLIVFLETGVVVTPLLPGDSLLFAAGVLAGAGVLGVEPLLVLLSVAAILGDSLNYTIGRFVGPKVFTARSRLFKHEHLVRTQHFYERHGAKTIVIARFVPIVRTFAPFVAGIGAMHYGRFLTYNVIGALLWVFICVLLGYFFGGQPFVQENFSLVILLIIAVSLLPIVIEVWRARAARARAETL